MEHENYQDLVIKIWEIANALEDMCALLNRSFHDEFTRLDRIAYQKQMAIKQAALPF